MKRFDKLTEKQGGLIEKEEYFIPQFNPKKPTHLMAKDGQTAFFWSNSLISYYRSRNHGHFWLIPPWARIYKFPIFRKDAAGWNYGNGPIWF